MGPGISRVVPGDFSQARRNANNEFTDRADDGFIIAIFIVVEPGAVVVVSKVFEKTEKVCWKTVEFSHAGYAQECRNTRRGELAVSVGFIFFFFL